MSRRKRRKPPVAEQRRSGVSPLPDQPRRAANRSASCPPQVASAPSTWPERAALLAILTAALVLRAWYFDRLGLVHFDEGIYVTSASLWSAYVSGPSDHPFHAYQPFYSPPLVPVVFGTGILVLSPELAPDRVALGLSILAGTATVFVLWRIARRWYGPAAALAAALVAATSDVHIRFSRMALTDVWLLLFFLLALAALQHAVSAPRRRTAILAGVLTGLAWNAKYNGWLPLAIALVALLTWWRASRPRQPSPSMGQGSVGVQTAHPAAAHPPRPSPTGRAASPASAARVWHALRSCAAAALVAGLLFLPWYLYVQSSVEGGYAAVVAHHRGYLQDLSHWPANLARQLASQFYLEGPASWIAPALALILAALRTRNTSPARWAALLLAAPALGVGAWRIGQLPVLAAVGLPALIARLRRSQRAAEWFHLVWLLVLLALTPMYLPYARLFLPLAAAIWVLGALGLARLAEWWLADAPRLSRRARVGVTAAAVLAAVLAAYPLMQRLAGWSHDEGHTWEPTDTLRRAADEIARRAPDGAAIFVYGEPALVYYLYEAGTLQVRQLRDLSIALDLVEQPRIERQPAYLVIGPRAHSESSYPRLAGGRTAWQQIAAIPADPGAVVRLDESAAGPRPLDHRAGDRFALRLFELPRPNDH